jgi:ubiquinone/menaquinone biosynthesis C-methylase UbiE
LLIELVRRAGRRYARFATNLAVRRPRLWPLLRPLMRFQFDFLASRWDSLRMPGYLDAFERVLPELEPPRRVLDLGTGTGLAAHALARRFPGAEIVGVDLAPEMVAAARRKTPDDLAGRVRFEVADASRLPFRGGSFDLITLNNMIPFFDELERVLTPEGTVLMAFSGGSETPIYVPFDQLRAELRARGFAQFAEFAAGPGTALLARKQSED